MSDRVDLTPEDPRTPEEKAGVVSVPGFPVRDDLEAERWEHPEDRALREGFEPAIDPLTEEEVATWLERVGRIFNAIWRSVGRFLGYVKAPTYGLGKFAWLFSDEELDTISPALTRVINRRFGRLAGVVRSADEIELAFRFEEYVRVNIAVIRDAEAHAEPPPAEEIEELPEGHPDRGPGAFGLEP